MPGMNKKGIELAISFVVIIIISLVVFAGSMVIVRNIFSGAEELKATLDQQTDSQIQEMLSAGEIVAVPLAHKAIAIGDKAVFWAAVSNAFQTATNDKFYVLVGLGNVYNPDGSAATGDLTFALQSHINQNWLFYDKGPHTIPIGDYKAISIFVSVGDEIAPGKDTKKGLYAFNVCVINATASGGMPGSSGQITAENCWFDANLKYLYPPDGSGKGHPFRFIVEVK
jgi:hypothetical protein